MVGFFHCHVSFGGVEKYQNYIIPTMMVSTPLKNMLIKLDHLPRDQGENNKCLKPPPGFNTHQVPLDSFWYSMCFNGFVHISYLIP